VASREDAAAVSPLEDLIPDYDAAFDALERGDLETFTELATDRIHPECQFHSGIGTMVGGGVYEGPEGIRGWFGDLIATTSERHWRNRRWEAYGDRVLLYLADLEFTGAGSGAPVTSETGAVAEFEDGLCVRMTSFMSHEEARRLAEERSA
jgi:ketosteroid isomerase-like protein